MKRRPSAYVLFTLYFLVYALSPLTYSVHRRSDHASGLESRSQADGAQRPHVLLWEFIAEQFAAPSAPQHGHDHDEATILLMKKRGLLPEDDLLQLSSAPAAILRSRLDRHCDAEIAKAVAAPAHNPQSGHHPPYSGHSPPAA